MTDPTTPPAPEPMSKEAASRRLLEICRSKKPSDMVEVARLVAAGADIHMSIPGGRNLLHVLVESGSQNTDLAEYLIAKGVNLEARCNSLNSTPILYATWGHSNPAMAKLFADCGASLSARDSVGDTALHNAALKNEPSVIEHILVNHDEVNTTILNNGDRSPLGNTRTSGHLNAAETLVKHGWPISDDDLELPALVYRTASAAPNETIALIRDRHAEATARWKAFSAQDPMPVHTLTREDICLFANIDMHHHVFENPKIWEGHRDTLIKLLCDLPPWLTRDIIHQNPEITQAMGNPSSVIEGWGAMHHPPVKPQGKAV